MGMYKVAAQFDSMMAVDEQLSGTMAGVQEVAAKVSADVVALYSGSSCRASRFGTYFWSRFKHFNANHRSGSIRVDSIVHAISWSAQSLELSEMSSGF